MLHWRESMCQGAEFEKSKQNTPNRNTWCKLDGKGDLSVFKV